MSVPAVSLNVPALLHAPAIFSVPVPERPIVPAVILALVMVDVPAVKFSVPPVWLYALMLLEPFSESVPAAMTKLPLLVSAFNVVVPTTPLS